MYSKDTSGANSASYAGFSSSSVWMPLLMTQSSRCVSRVLHLLLSTFAPPLHTLSVPRVFKSKNIHPRLRHLSGRRRSSLVWLILAGLVLVFGFWMWAVRVRRAPETSICLHPTISVSSSGTKLSCNGSLRYTSISAGLSGNEKNYSHGKNECMRFIPCARFVPRSIYGICHCRRLTQLAAPI